MTAWILHSVAAKPLSCLVRFFEITVAGRQLTGTSVASKVPRPSAGALVIYADSDADGECLVMSIERVIGQYAQVTKAARHLRMNWVVFR